MRVMSDWSGWSVTWNCQSLGYPQDHSSPLLSSRQERTFGNQHSTPAWRIPQKCICLKMLVKCRFLKMLVKCKSKWSDNWWIKYVNLFACLELMEEIDFKIFGRRPNPSPSSSLEANMSRTRRLRQAMSILMLVYQNVSFKIIIWTRTRS